MYLQDQGQSTASETADRQLHLRAGPLLLLPLGLEEKDKTSHCFMKEAADRLLRTAFPDNIA